jgi:hypothetical protein
VGIELLAAGAATEGAELDSAVVGAFKISFALAAANGGAVVVLATSGTLSLPVEACTAGDIISSMLAACLEAGPGCV